ncbi:hypothetical protein Tco_0869541 [Tanacetum coccineum]
MSSDNASSAVLIRSYLRFRNGPSSWIFQLVNDGRISGDGRSRRASDDDDDDDDTDDEDEEPTEDEEEEEHIASADSSAVPVVDPIPSAGDTKAFETDESAPTPRSPQTRIPFS